MSLINLIVQPKKKTNLVELDSTDIRYFNGVVQSIIVYPEHIQYLGRIKRLNQNNPFYTIFNDVAWRIKQKTKWQMYINKRFGSDEVFNEWCLSNRIELIGSEFAELSFQDDPSFNLVFMNSKGYLECYALVHPTYNKQVRLITTKFKNPRFWQEVVDYLRDISHLPSLIGKADSKVINTLKNEITKGFHIVNENIKLISNNSKTYCYAYVTLSKYKRTNSSDAWDLFISQFETQLMGELFCAWVYGIFVENDFNRQVLWLEGEGHSGKSTIVRVIGRILQEYNPDLFKSLASQAYMDKYSLSAFDKCRLAGFADSDNQYLLKMREIRNMTGYDHVSIREMNAAPRTAILQTKIIVTGNKPPIIDYNAKDETTRLLHLKLSVKKIAITQQKLATNKNKKSDEQQLYDQFWIFLPKCRKYYEKLKLPNGLFGVRNK